MSDTETYNGCANWATWYVVSHLDNVEDWYNESRRIASRSSNTKDLREYVEALLFEPIDETAYHADQETQRGMQHEISRREFDDVDWDEVHAHVLDEG